NPSTAFRNSRSPELHRAGKPFEQAGMAWTPERLKIRQLHDIAVILAASHPDVARAAVKRLADPAERAAALTEMGGAVESRFPARAEAFFRQAVRQAAAVPDPPARRAV